jgi:aryl-alcohol dehydrogenase-like predicted oxidoreductase
MRFEPLGRDLSTLVLGTALYQHAPLDVSVELLDAWIELGGNAIDTGRQYGNAEAVLGPWLRERSLYDDVVIITKAGHYDEHTGRPRVTRDDVTKDLQTSRRLLGLDSIPLLLLHRDDPTRPVGEILEELQPAVDAGHVRALGASNWTTARLEEAERYAQARSLAGFSCSSPNLSLAVANEEPWPGCVSIHEQDALAWYERRGLPVFAWSSLAGGFFAGVSTEHVTRTYVDDANAERLRRTRSLAAARGFTPSQVALAWVLHQPLPVYAVIGPRTVAELEENVRALDVRITDEDVAWLDLRSEEAPDGSG